MKIKNWDRWQNYRKDRGAPPWIKIQCKLLRNPEWVSLTDAQRGQLVAMWLLAADSSGEIPSDPAIIKKLCHLDKEPDLKSFVQKGFLESDNHLTTSCQPVGRPEESRGETETEERRAEERGAHTLPKDWTPSDSHYDLAKQLGLSMGAVTNSYETMRDWSWGGDKRRKDWNAVFNNWLKRDAGKNHGPRGSRPLQDDSLSASRAAARLAEQAERGNFSFGPRPGLSTAPSSNNVVMLPKGRDA